VFSSSARLWFFTGTKETDFVVAVDDELVGIKLKYQNSVDARDYSNFSTFKHRILLSRQDAVLSGPVPVIPAALFLALI
jgi:predicted AAA+ superfamily ATPase